MGYLTVNCFKLYSSIFKEHRYTDTLRSSVYNIKVVSAYTLLIMEELKRTNKVKWSERSRNKADPNQRNKGNIQLHIKCKGLFEFKIHIVN